MPQPLQIFIAYARKDAALLDELRIHLRPLERTKRAIIWYDGNIEPGAVWEDAIKKNLHAAEIILLLLSAHAIDSDYFYEKEMADALERHARGEARVVPLIIKPCAWKATPLAKLQALPKDAKPVSSWNDRDDAWNDAVEALLVLIEEREMKIALDPFHDLMISIKGGASRMGDEYGDLWDACRPVHDVKIKDFHLCKHPVTQAQWRTVMDADPAYLTFKGCDDCPVEGISWDDVQAFIKKLNEKTGGHYRLPTEAEWEYAARGGDAYSQTRYAGSNEVDEVAWYEDNSASKTQPVMQKKTNELGLYDMSGNVWEWCQDVWHENYKGAPEDGSAWTIGGDQNIRVVRGGSWVNNTYFCRVTDRHGVSQDYRGGDFGFRLAR